MPPEVIDPIAEEAGEEVVAGVEEEGVPDKPAVPAAEERIEKIVQGIKDKLDAPAAVKQPSQEEIRKAWREAVKKETQMTDQQIDYMEGRMQSVTAPLFAKEAFNEWKSERSELLTPEIEKAVKATLKLYPPQQHTDTVLLDNIMYMEIGKASATKKPVAKPTEEVVVTENSGLPRRKIVPITPGSAIGLNGAPPKKGVASLTDEERKIAQKMRMTDEEYAQAKTTVVITDLKRK